MTAGQVFYWAVFIITAVTALFAAVMVITRRNPISAAMFLVLNFLCIAILYLLLRFQFIAIIQVMIYAGAIMMLVVFVIMLLNVEEEERRRTIAASLPAVIGVIFVLMLCAQLIAGVGVQKIPGTHGAFTAERLAQVGDVKAVAQALFTTYLFPFEIASIILLVGIIGAVILSKKER
jgi:NADH-quinone oxidoreductase subunit J